MKVLIKNSSVVFVHKEYLLNENFSLVGKGSESLSRDLISVMQAGKKYRVKISLLDGTNKESLFLVAKTSGYANIARWGSGFSSFNNYVEVEVPNGASYLAFQINALTDTDKINFNSKIVAVVE